jgi:hypothetical protein
VYKSQEGAHKALEYYLSLPLDPENPYSIKTVGARPDDPRLLCLKKLEHLVNQWGSNITAAYKVENEMLNFAEIVQVLRRARSSEDSSTVGIETEDSFQCSASEERNASETASTWVLPNGEPGSSSSVTHTAVKSSRILRNESPRSTKSGGNHPWVQPVQLRPFNADSSPGNVYISTVASHVTYLTQRVMEWAGIIFLFLCAIYVVGFFLFLSFWMVYKLFLAALFVMLFLILAPVNFGFRIYLLAHFPLFVLHGTLIWESEKWFLAWTFNKVVQILGQTINVAGWIYGGR